MANTNLQHSRDGTGTLFFSIPRYVGNCSGGQQRRVSFAAAMVHEPELLILDEPTVGLDPLLREKIWQYLVETTSTSKMAVIITTHYIEEAKQAGFVSTRCGPSPRGEWTTYQTQERHPGAIDRLTSCQALKS